jgi:hypothetical protein
MTVLAWSGSPLGVRVGRVADATALRAWLADRWAIVFSHPEDFAQEELEMDRWLSVLGRSFATRAVVPVALARAGSEQGWLGALAALDSGSAATLSLDARPGTPTNLSAAALRAQVARSGPRFALIVDSSLRSRRTLSYRLPADLPSPLDLIGWAVALRKRDRAGDDRCETPGPSLPIRSGWVRNAHCPPAQVGRG